MQGNQVVCLPEGTGEGGGATGGGTEEGVGGCCDVRGGRWGAGEGTSGKGGARADGGRGDLVLVSPCPARTVSNDQNLFKTHREQELQERKMVYP